MRLLPLIKPRWNVTIAIRGATLQENADHQKYKTTGTGSAREKNVPFETTNSSTLVSCDGLRGYNAVPPPYTGNFLPLKPDLSGLQEFRNESIVSEPIVKKPVVEISEAKASAYKPKDVRKNFGPLIVED
nr:hypothetical protein [Tanacetum cinerariifolium]